MQLLCLLAAAALGAGCTLITDVDRSKIPAAEIVPPDPPPATGDAGEPPPATADAGGDASDAGDAGDAGGTVPPVDPPDAGDAG